jgi:hypothetical protein
MPPSQPLGAGEVIDAATNAVPAHKHAALPGCRCALTHLRDEVIRPRENILAASRNHVRHSIRGHALRSAELLIAESDEVGAHVPVNDKPVVVQFLGEHAGQA